MARIDPDTFSELTNALQQAALLSQQRAVAARTASVDADQLDAAIRRAVDAAQQLRPTGDEQS